MNYTILTVRFVDQHFAAAIDDLKPVTHLLAVDVASKKGIKLLHEGINYLVIICH